MQPPALVFGWRAIGDEPFAVYKVFWRRAGPAGAPFGAEILVGFYDAASEAIAVVARKSRRVRGHGNPPPLRVIGAEASA